jgi:uncharacterized protein involved in exopolysaccharide biosynthesis/Mrp family chromosome partitioning ATPase
MPPMPRGSDADLGGLGRALWLNKKRIIAVTLICAAGAFVAVNMMTPRYRSEVRILLEARENVFLRAEADKQSNDRAALDPEAVTSQIQLVLSRDLAREVIKKEHLTEKPEFAGGSSVLRVLLGAIGLGRDPASMSPDERTLEGYYDHLNVFAIEKSRVISINFTSANPDLAAQVTNTIAETYLHMQQAAKQQQTKAASQWLAGEIENMRHKVAEAEAKIEDYRTKTNLFSGSNNSSLPNQQLTEITSQIATARGQKADLEARARQLRELLRSGKPIDSSDISNSESMRRLIEQRTALRGQLAEQSSTLHDQHPRIKELRAQVAELDRQIHAEGERLARQLENDAKVAGNRLETLTASLDQVKQMASHTNEQDVQLRALEREGKAQRDLLESYLAKYREAAARENINAAPPEARIISRATPANKPEFPKKGPIILIAAFAGFALSSGFVVTGELLAPASYPYAYPVAAYAPVPAMPVMPVMPRMTSPPLAPAPMMPPQMAQPQMPVMPASAAAGTIEQIAAQFRHAGEAGRRIAVAGSGRNIGTTFAAISLARALARDSNVVLVDLAFGSPNLSVISSDPTAPGIAELVRSTASFGEAITRDQFSRVHLVATGNLGRDAAMIAASPNLPVAIEALARSYDHVVLDIGATAEIIPEQFAALAPNAMLVGAGASDAATKAARDRLTMAGFRDVKSVVGGSQPVTA